MDLATWECPKIWTASTSIDVVLSLGTGTRDLVQSPQVSTFRHIISDGFIPRLYRSLMSSLDGEQTWRDAVNRLDDRRKRKYFRLNVQFRGQEPRLDDVHSMDELRRSVLLQPSDVGNLKSIAFALLAASFYFELDTTPFYQNGYYVCRGRIRCRNDIRAVLAALRHLGVVRSEFWISSRGLGTLTGDDVCGVCHEYGNSIHFCVRTLSEIVQLDLGLDRERCNVSGFPRSIDWFIDQQRLRGRMCGEPNVSQQGSRCTACAMEHASAVDAKDLDRRKRKMEVTKTIEPAISRKKPRLRLRLRGED